MELSRMAMLFLALVALSVTQADARSLGPSSKVSLDVKETSSEKPKAKVAVPAKPVQASSEAPVKATVPAKKVASLLKWDPKVSPPIHTGSDKKFFGPPFPANYVDDKRPVADKAVMDKLRGPGQPYPALQGKADFDSDYVKDENADHGDWKAQFEYDYLRKKLAKEAAGAKGAGDQADKEARDVDAAQKNADGASKGVDDARKGVDDASKGGDDTVKDEDFGGPPSAEKLEKLKKAVQTAEENYEKEKKDFEQCQKALDEAKANLEELKAKQAEMEKSLASETKLWMETKTVRLNLAKSKEEAAHSKFLSAHERLRAAQLEKAGVDKVLADKKAVHAKAMEGVRKQKAQVEKRKKDLEKATLTLQKLRGYKPVSPTSTKSSASMASAVLSMCLLLAMHTL